MSRLKVIASIFTVMLVEKDQHLGGRAREPVPEPPVVEEPIAAATPVIELPTILPPIKPPPETANLASPLPQTVSAEADPSDIVLFSGIVNDVRKGDVMLLTPQFPVTVLWIEQSSFASLGIQIIHAETRDVEGQSFVALRASATLAMAVDLDRLELRLRVTPELLGLQTTSFAQTSPSGDADFLRSPHLAVNYDAAIRQLSAQKKQTIVRYTPIVAMGGWSLRSTHTYDKDDGMTQSHRLQTTATRDWPDALLRFEMGDVTPMTGLFGQTSPLAGVSLSRLYAMKPSFQTQPGFEYTGAVSVPSTAEIYVDGLRMNTVNLQPGRYKFTDLYYFSGLHDVEIRIVDANGKQQPMILPHYFSAQNLRAGLMEYHVSAGLPRGPNGDSDYKGRALSGMVRYGVQDQLTLSGFGEALDDYTAAGGGALIRMGYVGTVALNAAHSRSAALNTQGEIGQVNYQLAARRFAVGATALWQSPSFGQRADPSGIRFLAKTLSHQAAINMGGSIDGKRHLSLDATQTRFSDGDERRQYTVRLNQKIAQGLSFQTALGWLETSTTRLATMVVGVSYQIDRAWSSVSRAERVNNGTFVDDFTLSHSPELSDGLRGRLGVTRQPDANTTTVLMQRATAFGLVEGSTRRSQSTIVNSTWTSHELRAAGTIAAIDGGVYLGESVGDSFGVVRVDDVPNVRVYQNNQLIGKTDNRGALFVPRMASYGNNQLRIEDRDIPFDRQLASVERKVVPRAYMGSSVRFDLQRLSAANLHLVTRIDERLQALESVSVKIQHTGGDIVTFTAPDGEIYIENLPPGVLRLSTNWAGRACTATLTIPDPPPAHADYGEVICGHD